MRKRQLASAQFTTFIFCLLWIFSTAGADILFLNNGNEISCRIQQISQDKIYVKVEQDRKAYSRKDVLKVMFVKEWRLEGEDETSQIKDKALRGLLKNPAEQKDYPEAGSLIYLHENTHVVKEDLTYSTTHRFIEYILRERGKDSANIDFSYGVVYQKGEIEYARAITEGRIYYLADTSVKVETPYPGNPGYEKIRSVKLSIPNVDVGSIIDYRYRLENLENNIACPLYVEAYIGHYEPMRSYRLNVVTPKGINIIFSEHDIIGNTTIFNKNITERDIRYSWEARNIKPIHFEYGMPPLKRLFPNIAFCIEDDWKNVQKVFRNLTENNLKYSPELKAKVMEIIKGIDSPVKRVEAIYNWVVTEIALVPLRMNESSHIPRSPTDIFVRKTGNYLNKPYLFYAMLKEAGFTPAFVYLKDKELPEFVEALPSIRQFSVAAVLLDIGGSEQLICPLDNTRRYNELPGMLQGVTGIVLSNEGSDQLFYRTRLLPAEKESLNIKAKLILEKDGSLYIDAFSTFSGKEQADMRSIRDLQEKMRQRHIEKIVDKVHPNARLVSFDLENLDDLNRDIVLKLRFKIENYAVKAGDKFLAFQVPGLNYASFAVGTDEREYPLFWWQRHQETHEAEIKIPEGYKIYYLPEGISLNQDDNHYHAGFEYENGNIYFKDIFTRNSTEIPPDKYHEYKSFMESIDRFTDKWIVLSK